MAPATAAMPATTTRTTPATAAMSGVATVGVRLKTNHSQFHTKFQNHASNDVTWQTAKVDDQVDRRRKTHESYTAHAVDERSSGPAKPGQCARNEGTSSTTRRKARWVYWHRCAQNSLRPELNAATAAKRLDREAVDARRMARPSQCYVQRWCAVPEKSAERV